ncbi:MAG: hypothetical protein QNJ13_08640 [Paracoccaceae bacterium]|nr:hypothetical protein [Paracoccaceae bacterium]
MRQATLMLTAFAFLALALASMTLVMRQAPAFNPELRVDTVLGDWRVPVSPALYDAGEYRFQVGYGFLRGDDLALMTGETELPAFQTFLERVTLAAGHFERSLTLRPGKVDTWTALAWARFLAGDAAGAETALRASWRLSPHNFGETIDRLGLVEALDGARPAGWRDDGEALDAVATDLATLRHYDARYFAILMEGVPTLRTDAERAGLTEEPG